MVFDQSKNIAPDPIFDWNFFTPTRSQTLKNTEKSFKTSTIVASRPQCLKTYKKNWAGYSAYLYNQDFVLSEAPSVWNKTDILFQGLDTCALIFPTIGKTGSHTHLP